MTQNVLGMYGNRHCSAQNYREVKSVLQTNITGSNKAPNLGLMG
jgi:hypothetical protein